MAISLKPGMWIKTQEDEVLRFDSWYEGSAKGLFYEYDELGNRGYGCVLTLDGLVEVEDPNIEIKLGCDDLAHNLIPNLAELSDNVVHFHHDHVCVTMEFGGKRFAVQITEKL